MASDRKMRTRKSAQTRHNKTLQSDFAIPVRLYRHLRQGSIPLGY
jgi:hypothetical protein